MVIFFPSSLLKFIRGDNSSVVFVLQGLYPESSGIVGNSMYDPSLNESFRIGSSTSYNPHWWGGEPVRLILHNTARRI